MEFRSSTGGLINAIRPASTRSHIVWLSMGPPGVPPVAPDHVHTGLAFVEVSDALHDMHYNVVSNALLWPLFHGGFDRTRAPSFGPELHAAWAGYRAVNELFAKRVAAIAGPGETVIVHDYQLMVVPALLARVRPDLRVAFFHHIPFVGPDELRMLPRDIAGELVRSLSAVPSGFQSLRWQRAFESCRTGYPGSGSAPSFVAPVVPDVDFLVGKLDAPEVAAERDRLRTELAGRLLVARVDRADPMKNVHRGFAALDVWFTRHPDLVGRVTMISHLVPTRLSVAGYASYAHELDDQARQVNQRWATDGWEPVVVSRADNYARAIALLADYDVLLVNPVREGMNLVAQEGPLLNQRGGVLILSDEVGTHDMLNGPAVSIHPLDVSATADALAEALSMSEDERLRRHHELQARVRAAAGKPWHDQLVAAAEG